MRQIQTSLGIIRKQYSDHLPLLCFNSAHCDQRVKGFLSKPIHQTDIFWPIHLPIYLPGQPQLAWYYRQCPWLTLHRKCWPNPLTNPKNTFQIKIMSSLIYMMEGPYPYPPPLRPYHYIQCNLQTHLSILQYSVPFHPTTETTFHSQRQGSQ